MLSGEDLMVYHCFTNDLMFVRALKGAMDGNGFEKEKLERNILEWMPFKVGNHIQPSYITCS